MADKHRVVNDEVGVALVVKETATDRDVLDALDDARDEYLYG